MHQPLLTAVGAAIAHRRRAQKLTQQELADGSGFQRAYISALENGDRNPTVITLALIVEVLDWSLPALMRAAAQRAGRVAGGESLWTR